MKKSAFEGLWDMYRKTYVEIDLANLRRNVETLVARYPDYEHYIGVVKADAYGHGLAAAKTIADAGCGRLAVATVEEALALRQMLPDVPILCFGLVDRAGAEACIEHKIAATVSDMAHLRRLGESCGGLTVHVKVNTGMNRLGVGSAEELGEMLALIRRRGCALEGIYTHVYHFADRGDTLRQFRRFEAITAGVDLAAIPIVHIGASEATEVYPRLPYANGCRLGISMYGLAEYENSFGLLPTFAFCSEVVQINEVENETVGYDGAYRVRGRERIAVIAVGHADGLVKRNTGRDVFINGRRYPIVGNICMDMAFVRVDENVRVGDRVEVLRDIEHITEAAAHLGATIDEVLCAVSARVPRVYIGQ